MALESIQGSAVIPARPERIFEAWLSSSEHSAFTGGQATVEPRVGGRHTAWDGYIEGVNLALELGRRIVQSWRSSDFPDGSTDSRLEVLLEPANTGTKVTLVHTDIPEGQGRLYEQGWVDHYFTPMQEYFAIDEDGDSDEDEDDDEEAPKPAGNFRRRPRRRDRRTTAAPAATTMMMTRTTTTAMTRPRGTPLPSMDLPSMPSDYDDEEPLDAPEPAPAPERKAPPRKAPAQKAPAKKAPAKKAPAKKAPVAKPAPAKKKPAAKKPAPKKKPAAKKPAPAKKKPAAKKKPPGQKARAEEKGKALALPLLAAAAPAPAAAPPSRAQSHPVSNRSALGSVAAARPWWW